MKIRWTSLPTRIGTLIYTNYGWIHQWQPFVPDEYHERIYRTWSTIIGSEQWWDIQRANIVKGRALPITDNQREAAILFEQDAQEFFQRILIK